MQQNHETLQNRLKSYKKWFTKKTEVSKAPAAVRSVFLTNTILVVAIFARAIRY
jgi:hypothetical protein